MSAERFVLAALLAAILPLAATVSPAAAHGGGEVALRGPHVATMIVSSTGAIVSPARIVVASAASVRVGRRNCAVAAGTPLAVLAAVRRAAGPTFAVRDYGHCDGSPVNSGQLFVYSLAGESNSGQSGWEYKVDNVSGSTGAGDPSGPRGDGRRLRSGERVLWFWCVASAGGCERTLEVRTSASTVSRGASLAVTVTGYDNEGHGAPVAGAIVTLGTDFASTGTGGRATLIAPAASGSYSVRAQKRGLVGSFPQTIAVR
jgi:hypothetical protein